MNSVQHLHQTLRRAEAMGFEIRQECLDGAKGGICEVAGKRLLFVDLSLSAAEQLDQALEALDAAGCPNGANADQRSDGEKPRRAA